MNINSLQADAANRIAPSAASGDVAQAPELPVIPEDPAPILGGKSLSVTQVPEDIAKLAALLLSQTNEAREDALLGTLRALSSAGVFEQLHANATAANDKVYTQLETLAQEKIDLEAQLPAKKKAANDAKAALDAAQEAFDSLPKDASEEDIKAAKEKLSDAKTANTNAQDALNDLKEAIAAKETAMHLALMGLDTEGYRQLADTLGIDFSDLYHTTPLQDVTEGDPGVGNIPLTERSPVSIIRESLRNLAGDFTDNLATRREQHV